MNSLFESYETKAPTTEVVVGGAVGTEKAGDEQQVLVNTKESNTTTGSSGVVTTCVTCNRGGGSGGSGTYKSGGDEKTIEDQDQVIMVQVGGGGPSFSDPNTNVVTISIKCMDDEHEECFQLLRDIANLSVVEKSGSMTTNKQTEYPLILLTTAIENLYQHLQEHFHHEEQLMNQVQFGGGKNGPGYRGHQSDHNVILKYVVHFRDTVDEYFKKNRSSSSSNNNSKQQQLNDSTPLLSTVIQQYVNDIESKIQQHIQHYDLLYVPTFQEAGISE